ncbi:MAG: TIGR04211 family SH3 domain-containing protein, partial [Desulfopila sp.]|nr:TIGR04211 family SH3 domain-containing protein [Desulfopila sp.]
GVDYKILAIVPNGTAVTLVEEIDSWVKVRTDDGKEGWILKRYLSEDPPLEERFQEIEIRNNQLEEELTKLQSENEKLHALNDALESTLENNTNEMTSTMEEYQQLVEDTSDVITIKNNLEESRQVIAALQQELESVVTENEQLEAGRNIKWFLAGGGTLIFGCIVGMISARSKKRKSSLY